MQYSSGNDQFDVLKDQIADAQRLLELVQLHMPTGHKLVAERLVGHILSRARTMLKETQSHPIQPSPGQNSADQVLG